MIASLFFVAIEVRAQSALDGFDPNANGLVRTIVLQPDGKIVIGGDFTSVAPNGGPAVTRNRIARFNPDGTLDATFDPNADNSVLTLALQADGKILAGGTFLNVGGLSRARLARLGAVTGAPDGFDPEIFGLSVTTIVPQPDGQLLIGGSFTFVGVLNRQFIARLDPVSGAPDGFNPKANNLVAAIRIQPDGQILIGGSFTELAPNGGATVMRNRLARLHPNGSVESGFDPNANGLVNSFALQADGRILAGGQFTSMSGQSRNFIARLNSSTGQADSFNPSANGQLNSIALQTDGRILVGGNFLNIGGQERLRLARLDPITGLADSFDPGADGNVVTIVAQPDGKLLVGGSFTAFAPNGGPTVARNSVARLEIEGRVDQTLNLNTVGTHVFATAVQPDGKILIGGIFTNVLGVARNNIARLNTDGTLDLAFNPNANGSVLAIAVQADGKILVSGDFNGANSIGGETRNRIARLDPTNGLADSFNPNASSFIFSIAVQADGQILVGGDFNGANSIGGETRNRIARLDPTGAVDLAFDPNANDWVQSIAVQADGRILVGGSFTSIGGQTRNRIARLETTGAVDLPFDPDANTGVYSIAVQMDGRILVGGRFTSIGGVTRRRIARLDPTTGSVDSFDPDAAGPVYSIAVQADGRILVGGLFTGVNSIGGQSRNHIARLDPITGLADSFNPDADLEVYSLAVQPDGKILVGGRFTSIGAQPRSLFARLNNDTAALQSLAVSQSAVTWTRGGSSPQFARVTFAVSTDNVNFTPLGAGTADGSNWTLAGLSLPTAQNIHIRARGFSRNGQNNGSESITESVQNAHLASPPTLLGAASRKMHGAAADFDVDLPLTGNPGVECRSGGATNDYQVVLTFASSVTFDSASITSGAGSVSSSSGGGSTTITVDLTGVTNAQTITVTLAAVSNGSSTADVSVQMGVLLGDTNGSRTVTASDIGQTKSQSGQSVGAGNFRTDVNANGSINASDVGQVKAQSGTALP